MTFYFENKLCWTINIIIMSFCSWKQKHHISVKFGGKEIHMKHMCQKTTDRGYQKWLYFQILMPWMGTTMGRKYVFSFAEHPVLESRNQSYCRDHLILHYFHLLSSHPILIYPGSNIQCLTVVDCLTGQTVHKYVLSQISKDCGSNPFLKQAGLR